MSAVAISITSVTYESSTSLRVMVAEEYEPDEAIIPGDWLLRCLLGLGVTPAVIDAVRDPDDDSIVLTLYPALTAGCTYEVSGKLVLVEGEFIIGEIGADWDEVTVPGGWVQEVQAVVLDPLTALLATIGRQTNRIAGVPCSKVHMRWAYGDTQLVLKSTLRFPDRGTVIAGKIRLSYTGKTSGSLIGVSSPIALHPTSSLAKGTRVTFEESSRVPSDL